MVVCVEGLADADFTDNCHQVVRFVGLGLGFFIELVERQVFVVVVRDALVASLRKVDVLQ